MSQTAWEEVARFVFECAWGVFFFVIFNFRGCVFLSYVLDCHDGTHTHSKKVQKRQNEKQKIG